VIPETIGAVLGLLFVVGPGLVFEVVREHYRPPGERSAFREAATVALASLVFTSAALAILAIVRSVRPTVMPDPRLWLIDGRQYVVEHYQLVTVFVVALGSISIGLSAVAAWQRFRGGGGRLDPNSTGWYELFRARVPAGTEPMVRVQLDDGNEYLGVVAQYSVNVLPAERELVLKPPLRIMDASGQFVPLPGPGTFSRIFIPGPSIRSFWVRYPPKRNQGGVRG